VGQDLDRGEGKRTVGGLRVSPHGMIQDYLNRTPHLWGIVTNPAGVHIALRALSKRARWCPQGTRVKCGGAQPGALRTGSAEFSQRILTLGKKAHGLWHVPGSVDGRLMTRGGHPVATPDVERNFTIVTGSGADRRG
jgi:hypothetical protein